MFGCLYEIKTWVVVGGSLILVVLFLVAAAWTGNNVWLAFCALTALMYLHHSLRSDEAAAIMARLEDIATGAKQSTGGS